MDVEISPSSSLNIKLSISPSSDLKKTIYFGYGSNLWLHQMRVRCPTSKCVGIAGLKGYKWIIYDRGYANIVELSQEEELGKGGHYDYSTEVWGLVYFLEPSDEARLDGNEGVARGAYGKEWIECEFWPASSERSITENTEHSFAYAEQGRPDTTKKPGEEKMLVYINRDNVREGKIKHEYVYRMNEGIRDALREGLPKGYVEQVLRKWIPEVTDERVRKVAQKQALEFEDET